MEEIMNKALFRLRDTKNDNIISCFYTENPAAFLNMLYFMYEKHMPIHVPAFSEKVAEFYKDHDVGWIEEIEVAFGSHEAFPCVDVWTEVWA